ncbi:MAG: hypothetical protein ACWA41_08685 [Putridiphycobacter sp.]
MKKGLLIIYFTALFNLVFAQDNQNIETAKMENGSYKVYKTIQKSYNKNIFELAKKPWPIEFYKTDDQTPKILIKRVGIVEEFYTADLPAYPAYYFGGNGDINVSIIAKKVYYYTWSAKSGANIQYILTNDKPSSYLEEKETLDNYRKTIKKNQVDARNDRKEQNAEIAKKEAEENTLKGKSVKSIQVKFVDTPKEIGMLSVVQIGFIVTLADGKILKTKNLGGKTPYTDFKVEAKSGDYSGGDFKVSNDCNTIIDDKIYLTVYSKYQTNIKGEFSYPLNYKSNIYYQYQGGGGAFGRGSTVGYSEHGGNGKDGRDIQIATERLTINGNPVIQYTIYDNYGQVLALAKVHEDYKITINLNGGNGGNGADGRHCHSGNGGNGGDGGNGGSATLSGSAKNHHNIIITTQGGRAGTGGSPKVNSVNYRGQNGANGSNGSIIK